MANESKQVFSGTTTTAVSLAATLANNANTYTGLANCTMNQVDQSTTPYPLALGVLTITDTFAAAPTAGAPIDWYATLDDIESTSDETPVPGSSDILYLATPVGHFVMDNQDVATRKWRVISLEGMLKSLHYLLNLCGQTISYSATATTLKVTPFSYGPA